MNLLQKIQSKDIKERWTLVQTISTNLKTTIPLSEFPEWFNFTKTGWNTERVPLRNDWYFIRMASMLVHLIHNPRRTQKLRNKYGKLKNRGSKPDKWFKAGGSMIRHMLQILEKHELVSKHKKGRYTSSKGKEVISLLL